MKGFMEIILLLILIVASESQQFIVGLNIDPSLIAKTNRAISQLQQQLRNNIRCKQINPNHLIHLQAEGQLIQSRCFRKLSWYNRDYKYHKPSFNIGSRFLVLYTMVSKVASLLLRVKSHIIQYNNVIIGDYNEVDGQKNVVIGSQNDVKGNNNWIFASDYDSKDPENGVLIIGQYLIELYDAFKITYDVKQAIRCLDGMESQYHSNQLWRKSKLKRRLRM